MYKILLCVLLAPCTGISAVEDYVYELHVTLPPAVGQDQTKEMKTIQKIITDNVKRNYSYMVKHIAKPEVFAFLTIENACIWEDISEALVAQNYIYDVTPLRKLEDYAEEIGIPNFPKAMQARELKDTIQYSLWRYTFPQKDRTNAEYKALIKRHLMTVRRLGNKTPEICWVLMAREPFAAVEISPAYSPQENDRLEEECEKDDEVEEQRVEFTPVVLLESFTNSN